MRTFASPNQCASLPKMSATALTFEKSAQIESLCEDAKVTEDKDVQHSLTDSPLKSLAKALTWRVLAASVTFGVAWSVTGSTAFAATIGAADTAIKIGVYYVHERAWLRVQMGSSKNR